MRTRTVPKPGNPNIVEVYADPEDDPYHVEPYSDQPTKRSLEDEEDGVVIDDVVQTTIGRRQPHVVMPGLEPDQRPSLSKGLGEEEEGGGEIYGESSAGTKEFPAGGVFLYDWDNGTPQDSFNLAALQRRMLRKAEMLTQPVMLFVADVAQKTGTSLNNMIVKPSAPLVSTTASTVDQLIKESRLSDMFLSVILAQTLQEILDASGKLVKELSSSSFKRVKVEDDKRGDVQLTPPPTPSKDSGGLPFDSGGTPTTTMIQAAARIESHVPDLIDNPFGNVQTRPPPMGGGGGGQQPQNPLAEEMAALLRNFARVSDAERWAWNELPENCGFSIVRPEVIGAIQTAHSDIQRISGAHRDIKLWHLITSPGVRHHFALMVSGMLNASPGEIQYPHYTRNFRGNDAATGARISSGLWSQAKSCSLYKEKMLWFRNVRYGTSTQWEETQKRLPATKHRLSGMRTHAFSAVREVRAILVDAHESLWNRLGFDTDDYKLAIAHLHNRQRVLADAVTKVEELQVKYTRAAKEGQDLSGLVQRIEVQRLAVKEIQKQIRALSYDIINELVVPRLAPGIQREKSAYMWVRALSIEGWTLIPFIGYDEQDPVVITRLPPGGIQAGDRFVRTPFRSVFGDDTASDYEELLDAAAPLVDTLRKVIGNLYAWHGEDADQMIGFFEQCLERLTTMVGAIRELTQTVRQYTEDMHRQREFTEMDKQELFYFRPSAEEVRPLRDYSRPQPAYADY